MTATAHAGRWPLAVLAARAVSPDRRRSPRNDFVLLDRHGRPLGTVSSARALRFGPASPTLYLAREWGW
ncbi:MAG: hypothetical protein OER21_03715 [Gemmatimonadota bacterium]|nr:hypothetical protein [Gemmatimonadota bacterium]